MWVGGLPGHENQHVRVRVAETVVSARIFFGLCLMRYSQTRKTLMRSVIQAAFFSRPGCYMDLMNMEEVTGREDSVTLSIIRTHAHA